MKFIFLFLFLLPLQLLAAPDFILSEIELECTVSEFCATRKLRYSNLIGNYRSLLHLKETLRILATDGGYESLSYQIIKKAETHKLIVKMKLKPTIDVINIGTVDRNLDMDPIQLITIKEGDFFETQKLKADLINLQKRLETMGYPYNSHQLNVVQKEDKVIVNLAITLGEPRVFKRIKTNSTSTYVNQFLESKFFTFYNKPFEYTKFKLYLDEAQKELFSYGYYLINMDFTPDIKKNRVVLDIKITQDKLFAFDFKNLKKEHREVIHELVKDLFRKYKRPLSESIIKMAIEDHYNQKALLNAEVRIETEKYRNRYMENVTLYRLFLDEGEKTRLTGVNFLGNSHFSKSQLKEMFDKEAFELAKLRYYDHEYFNYFVGYLKSKYIEKGFVHVKVVGPATTFDSQKKDASIEYIIQEGQRAFVRNLVFEGLPPELEDKVLSKVTNKAGVPFNPIALAEDLKLVTSIMQEKGYYFGEILNTNDETLVAYSKSGADVDLRYIIDSGPMVKLNRIIYLGNNHTRKKVLAKKILLEPGEIITPEKTRNYEANISATGLFNSVSVTPVRHSSKINTATDLIVKVTEREFGLVEFAPGYRTDLGIKLTGTVSYMNIGGMNRAVTLRSQVNYRLNNQTLDPTRREQGKKFWEHNTSLTYTQGDIFNTLIDSSTSTSYQRKRFYSFDADIARANLILTRDITKRFTSSARYQIENIIQSNATEERDNGSFRIGAITPSLTYDLRNSPVLPVRGAFFNLSCEFANPFFGSQKEADLTINYYKLVSRNRFYIPYKNGTVAISMVAGTQKNLATEEVVRDGVPQTEGYIPNIKVFRLTGMDIVRGFNDEEINRVPGESKDDISEVKIDDRAYLANFKVEPRYFINDALMAGVFYDAGRVFVNQVDFSELRDSVGITFKILTPVGTLDFDYGIKLLRERNKDGTLEDPGRFHVSIGFF
ncbi:MAG: BamA/TamA family outer membrane protein [Bdellovibrionales bacterium]|nr:BamA/TamA family outer membrane protein [Bdellovibrionales bacterium]